MKLNLVGTAIGNTGYAHHIRNLAKALDQQGHDTAIETQAPHNWPQLVDPWTAKLIQKNNRTATQILINYPPAAYLKSGEKELLYQYCVFEGTKIPTSWRQALNQDHIQAVITPSKHTKTACERAGVHKPIHVVPHGVDTTTFHPDAKPTNPDPKTTTFLWHKGWAQGKNDRSGLELFLEAYTQEFNKEDKVRALVKINPTYAQKNYAQEIKNLQLKGPHTKTIYLVTDILTPDNLAGFYTSGDVFVASSKGDAFDLPALEAMACGLPVIYSTHNGHDDYCKGYPLTIGQYIKPGDPNPLYEEAQWYSPSIPQIRKHLRESYENVEHRRELGRAACKHAQTLTWDNSAKKLIKAINA